jgi:hypothetical protein
MTRNFHVLASTQLIIEDLGNDHLLNRTESVENNVRHIPNKIGFCCKSLFGHLLRQPILYLSLQVATLAIFLSIPKISSSQFYLEYDGHCFQQIPFC